MIAGILLLIILLALGPVASKIPAAVLAGILDNSWYWCYGL